MTRPRFTLAHVAVFGAIACTMFFNASYAIRQAGAHEHQAAMVVLALTIDLAKATFLPAAAAARARGLWFGPLLLVLLWLPALTYSTFAGYAYLTTTRSDAHVDDDAQAQARARIQATYDRATADLTTAKTSADWDATAACTRTRTPPQRSFCANVKATETKLEAAAVKLTATRLTHVNPEITALGDVLGWERPTLTLLIALFPAVLIELVAGLGLYALKEAPGQRTSIKAPERAQNPFPPAPPPHQPTPSKKTLDERSDAPSATSQSHRPLQWKRPATP